MGGERNRDREGEGEKINLVQFRPLTSIGLVSVYTIIFLLVRLAQLFRKCFIEADILCDPFLPIRTVP